MSDFTVNFYSIVRIPLWLQVLLKKSLLPFGIAPALFKGCERGLFSPKDALNTDHRYQ